MHRPLVQAFSVKVRTLQGHIVKGEFGEPNRHPRPRREVQNLIHRTFSAPRISPIRPGEIIEYQGTHFLLLDQHDLVGMKRFLAVQCNEQHDLTRMMRQVNPVTTMEESNFPQIIASQIPVVVEPLRWSQEYRVEHDIYRILSGHDLRDEDILGPYQILRRADLLGATVVEATRR